MSRSPFLRIIATVLVVVAAPASAQDDSALIERARRIHEAVITIDTHDDIPGNYATPEMNPCTGTRMQVDVYKSGRNIHKVTISPASDLNAYTILASRRLLVTKGALDALRAKAAPGRKADETTTDNAE